MKLEITITPYKEKELYIAQFINTNIPLAAQGKTKANAAVTLLKALTTYIERDPSKDKLDQVFKVKIPKHNWDE